MDWYRKPSVAGRFYPADGKALRASVDSLCSPLAHLTQVRGIIVPHAGYIYSGKIAGEVYRRIHIPERVVILCPNHTGLGCRISVWTEGTWLTPLGEIGVDSFMAGEIIRLLGTPGDTLAHLHEHAIEVHLPFLQSRNPNVKILPIVLGQLTLQQCLQFSNILTTVLEKEVFRDTLLVASTDMSHYISAQDAKKQDDFAIQKIKEVDPEGLYRVVIEKEISMCGYIPTTCVLKASTSLGTSQAKLVAYGHSGERTGEMSSVVGYVSALLF